MSPPSSIQDLATSPNTQTESSRPPVSDTPNENKSSALTVYQLVPVNSSNLSEEDIVAIEAAPVVVATPAEVHSSPSSIAAATSSRSSISRVNPNNSSPPNRSCSLSTRQPESLHLTRQANTPLPLPHVANVTLPPVQRPRLWPSFHPCVNYSAAISASVPSQTVPPSRQHPRRNSTNTEARSFSAAANNPRSRSHTYNVGDRVVILDHYLNLYGHTGVIIETHPVQVTLQVIVDNQVLNIRKKKSKIARVVR